jgi:hypothetical protein
MKVSKVKDLRKLPLVKVVWHDAQSTGSWMSLAEARAESDLVEVETVGWLIRKDKRVTTVIQTINGAGGTGNLWSIPSSWINSVKRLK